MIAVLITRNAWPGRARALRRHHKLLASGLSDDSTLAMAIYTVVLSVGFMVAFR